MKCSYMNWWINIEILNIEKKVFKVDYVMKKKIIHSNAKTLHETVKQNLFFLNFTFFLKCVVQGFKKNDV